MITPSHDHKYIDPVNVEETLKPIQLMLEGIEKINSAMLMIGEQKKHMTSEIVIAKLLNMITDATNDLNELDKPILQNINLLHCMAGIDDIFDCNGYINQISNYIYSHIMFANTHAYKTGAKQLLTND